MRPLSSLDSSKLNNFDLIRFVAASLVIFSHSYAVTSSGGDPLSNRTGFITFGALAVEIFFVASGFLVSRSLILRNDPLSFLLARALRIFPGLAVCCLVTAFVVGPLFTTLPVREYFSNQQTWSYLFGNASLLSLQWSLPGVFSNHALPNVVNGSLWTLPTEFKMYVFLFCAGIAIWLARTKGALLVGGLSGTCLIYLFVAEHRALANHVSADAIPLIACFLAGSCIYALRERMRISIAICVAAWFVTIFIARDTPLISASYYPALAYTVIVCAYHPWLKAHNFGRFGDFSYGLYLYGYPTKQVVLQFLPTLTAVEVFLIAFPITLIISITSWRFFESRALAQKDKATAALTRVWKKR